MEEEFSVRVRAGPPPAARLLPSERRYSASTALGLALVHLALALVAALLLAALWRPVSEHAHAPEPHAPPVAAVLAAAATLALAAALPGAAGLLAWHRWYEDRNIRWLLGAAAVSAAGALASLATTSAALASARERWDPRHMDPLPSRPVAEVGLLDAAWPASASSPAPDAPPVDEDPVTHVFLYPSVYSAGDPQGENKTSQKIWKYISDDSENEHQTNDTVEPEEYYPTTPTTEHETSTANTSGDSSQTEDEETRVDLHILVNTERSYQTMVSDHDSEMDVIDDEPASSSETDGALATALVGYEREVSGIGGAGAGRTPDRRGSGDAATTPRRRRSGRELAWDPQATVSLALSLNLIAAAVAEFAWSLWTLVFALRGARSGYPGDEERRAPSPQPLASTPAHAPKLAASDTLRRPDIISNHQQKDPILQETTMPYQERVRRFLASEASANAETHIE